MEALAYIPPNLKFEFDYRITTAPAVFLSLTYNGLIGKSKKIRLSDSVCQKEWLRLWSFWRQIWKRKVFEVDEIKLFTNVHCVIKFSNFGGSFIFGMMERIGYKYQKLASSWLHHK